MYIIFPAIFIFIPLVTKSNNAKQGSSKLEAKAFVWQDRVNRWTLKRSCNEKNKDCLNKRVSKWLFCFLMNITCIPFNLFICFLKCTLYIILLHYFSQFHVFLVRQGLLSDLFDINKGNYIILGLFWMIFKDNLLFYFSVWWNTCKVRNNIWFNKINKINSLSFLIYKKGEECIPIIINMHIIKPTFCFLNQNKLFFIKEKTVDKEYAIQFLFFKKWITHLPVY